MADDDLEAVAERVRELLGAGSNRGPDEVHGGDRLGDPPPLGISVGTLKGMIPALNDIIHDYKPKVDLDFNKDVSKLKFVSDLIGLIWQKAGVLTE